MRVANISPDLYKKDGESGNRSYRPVKTNASVKRAGQVFDLVDLSGTGRAAADHPAWLETYLRLLPDEVAVERTRHAFRGKDGFLEKILFEIL